LKISKPLKSLVADANVILSAVIGKAALKIFTNTDIKIITTQFNIGETLEYLPRLAEKYKLELEILESQLKLLSLVVYQKEFYEDKLKIAFKKVGEIDPEDIDLLALAIKLDLPTWSNDKDFKKARVEVFTTAEVLKMMGL